jgi:4-hydroxybenzoate polyprenyltransferase
MASIAPDLNLQEPRPREAPFWYRLYRRLEEYALLMRLDRPIGAYLLLWPTLWALWIAGNGRPDPRILLVFVGGVIAMRSAGCIVNDFADRDLDPHVKRTRARPLAARRVTPTEAIVLFVLLAALSLWLVTRLDDYTVSLSVVGAVLAVSYPFVKRFFPLPQLYLGVAFGWAVPMAFAAQTGALPRVAWVLFFATVLWAGVYDTMYAMVDREDDLKVGVRSSAILFADMDRFIIAAMQVMMLLALALAGRGMQFGPWYYAGLGIAALFFLWQQWLIRTRDPAACFRAFLNNHYVGLAIFIGVLMEYVYRSG